MDLAMVLNIFPTNPVEVRFAMAMVPPGAHTRISSRATRQELGLGHFEGRNWRGFDHHATLRIELARWLLRQLPHCPFCGSPPR